jgi:GNAT superfamily N-acetyltransferase
MHREDLITVGAVVSRAFDKAIAPDYSAEGIAAFAEYADPDAMSERLGNNHEALVAEDDGLLVGVVEVRSHRHISMLFVDPEAWGRGIGRALLDAALDLCRAQDPPADVVTVHSSPYAVPFYAHAGFTQDGPATEVRGIISVPMSIALYAR